jgi:DNA-binding HxlR family transcriptional regulator
LPDRSYGQFCGLARALDVIGDRWSLLIVRELMTGPRRHGELAGGLPGIASNLLAERLRTLEASGVLERRIGETKGILYALTPWGERLREPVEALIRWSTPLMAEGISTDAFDPRWLAVALQALLRGRSVDPPIEIGIDVTGVLLAVQIDKHGPRVTVEPKHRPHTVLKAGPEAILGLAAGAISRREALANGSIQGDRRAVSAILGTA